METHPKLETERRAIEAEIAEMLATVPIAGGRVARAKPLARRAMPPSVSVGPSRTARPIRTCGGADEVLHPPPTLHLLRV
jgi:hypothetical protein